MMGKILVHVGDNDLTCLCPRFSRPVPGLLFPAIPSVKGPQASLQTRRSLPLQQLRILTTSWQVVYLKKSRTGGCISAIPSFRACTPRSSTTIGRRSGWGTSGCSQGRRPRLACGIPGRGSLSSGSGRRPYLLPSLALLVAWAACGCSCLARYSSLSRRC